ncbi:MAG: hypothetical protein Kow00123_17840 [Anaerolineales bacterium]
MGQWDLCRKQRVGVDEVAQGLVAMEKAVRARPAPWAEREAEPGERPRAKLPGGSGYAPSTLRQPHRQDKPHFAARQPGQLQRVVRPPSQSACSLRLLPKSEW